MEQPVPDLAGRRIDVVRLDHGLYLWTDDNWEVLLAGPVSLVPDDGDPTTREVDGPGPDELPGWADLVGRTVRAVTVSPAGRLDVVLDDRRLSVEPSPDYEAWQLAGHDGERLIGGPGGRVTHVSPVRRRG